jgi:hypothetical protein
MQMLSLSVFFSLLGMQPACAQGCNGVQSYERRSRDADVGSASHAQIGTRGCDRVPQDTRELYIEIVPFQARHLYCK